MRISPKWRWSGLVAVALLAAGPLAAQQSLVLDLVDRGKPLPDVTVRVRDGATRDVLAFANRGKPVGTTGAQGSLTIDPEEVEFADGARVEVWVAECVEGRVEVVLSEAGGDDPCTADVEEVEEGARCGCRRIGAFVWGARRVVVDVGARTVATAPLTGPSDAGPTRGPTHLLGIGVGISRFTNLEDAVSNQPGLVDAELSSTRFTLPFFYELHPSADLPFAFGVGGSYTDVGEIRQTFDPAAGGPSLAMIDLTRWSVWAELSWYQTLVQSDDYAPLNLRAAFQTLWMFNDIRVRSALDGGVPVEEDRSESGLRLGVLGGVDWFFTPRFGIRLEGGFLFGKGDDADTSVEWRAYPLMIRLPW